MNKKSLCVDVDVHDDASADPQDFTESSALFVSIKLVFSSFIYTSVKGTLRHVILLLQKQIVSLHPFYTEIKCFFCLIVQN